MCYNAAYDAERAFKKAIRDEQDPEVKRELERRYEQWKEKNPDIYRERRETINLDRRYYSGGFQHEHFPAMVMHEGKRTIEFLRWGLIPRWCKYEEQALKLWNQCINARSETMFEKPSFRASALDRRCVIYMTGFFEYHHQGKNKYPFFIRDIQGEVMLVGGIWDIARTEDRDWMTFSVITVPANAVMAKIHNNPKNPNRMPLILRPDQVVDWLTPTEKNDLPTLQHLKADIIQPYPADGLMYYTVPQLQGKNGVGDSEEAQTEVSYEDLELVL